MQVMELVSGINVQVMQSMGIINNNNMVVVL